MVKRVAQKDTKLYLIPPSKNSYAYFHENLPGRHAPEITKINADFSEKTYCIFINNFRNLSVERYLTLNALGRLQSQHPIYHPKLKKISADQYCISFVLKEGEHQWLTIIKDNKPIPAGFVYYEDEFGEEDI